MPQAPSPTPAALSDRDFRDFRELILAETGIALKDSKRILVESRLSKRLRSLGFNSYRQYYDYVVSQPGHSPERVEMVNSITTNKTDFFRENHHFEFLRARLIAEASERAARGAQPRLRLWSAGCSSGEEPYSMAITILEKLGIASGWNIRILASDIDTQVLRRAAAGVYDGERLQPVARVLLQKYFRRRVNGASEEFQAKESLKDLIRFRQINFTDAAWPIHTRFDAIFCRNVIIYFDRDLQRRLLERLVRYLEPHGYLVVGHSENLHWIDNNMLVSEGNTVYRLRARS